MAPRVLLAPDKFKGSLSAAQVAAHLAAGLRAAVPGIAVDELPVADGGEGTVEAALAAGYDAVTLSATGPLGAPVATRYARRGTTAVLEMAAVSGLEMVDPDTTTARSATSRGLGELLVHALDDGAATVVIGVGGSASTDGGAGMLAALGARLTGPAGGLPDGGGALGDLVSIDLSGLHPRLVDARIVLASDVDNPLLGPVGAAAVYGPQKGADPRAVAELEGGLATWVTALETAGVGGARALAEQPGAGAAGGVGYACLLLGAVRRAGVEEVLELTGFHERLAGADLVITGEGSLDEQSLHGKTPVGVAAAAAAASVPAVAVCGRTTLPPERAAAAGLVGVYALTDIEPDVARCIAEAGPLLEHLAARVAGDRLGSTTPHIP
ncbi:glycerate kinase [Georgenia satyanarayanai]|uniref:glycerate kinase n=1 Tax=Georgenia satyanarayanai TaxID=860221 RepID=UPI0020413891|nr:glycerate kinase [Georgenia satyanarayanai]MCM3660602.1 glycerate kinase [Georgenia satyanarayanai]